MTPKHKYPEWEPAYQSAVLETDNELLPTRIAEAEKAILMRSLNLLSGPEHEAERTAIQDALHNIRVLKTERLVGRPDR